MLHSVFAAAKHKNGSWKYAFKAFSHLINGLLSPKKETLMNDRFFKVEENYRFECV